MINQLLNALGWMSTLLIYDPSSINILQQLSEGNSSIIHEIISYDNQTDIQKFLSHMDTTKNHRQFNILLYCSHDCVQDILNKSSSYEKELDSYTSFKHRSRWLIFLDECYDTDFQNVAFDHITIVQSKQNISKSIDVCNLMWRQNRKREFSMTSLSWPEVRDESVFPNLENILNGIQLRVVTKVWPPFVIETNSPSGYVYTGLCLDLLDVFAGQLNFTYIIQFPKDNEWGQIVDGRWTGIIGDLQRKVADISVASIAVSNEREHVMDFTFPFLFNKGVAIFKLRRNDDEKWLTLIRPFTWKVLLCIGVSLILSAFVYHMIEIFNPFYLSPVPVTFWRRLEYLYGALLAHGSPNEPKALAGRLFLGFWWIFCIILAASYSGTLIATLTVTKDKFPFTSLEELIGQDTYYWGTLGNTLHVPLFSNSNHATFKAIWSGMLEKNSSSNQVLNPDPAYHFNAIHKDNYVFLSEESFYHTWSSNSCDIKILEDKYFSMDFAVGLQNNSPYIRQFSHMSLLVLESNLMAVWKNKWMSQGHCESLTQTMSQAVDLVSLQSVFYFLLIGLFLALLALGCEHITIRTKRKKLDTVKPIRIEIRP